MRRILRTAFAVLLVWATGARAGVSFENTLDAPESYGDQLIYYYDARPEFTTFLTLRNGSESAHTIELQFYGPSFDAPFSRTVTMGPGNLSVIDVGSLRGSGLPSQPGIAIATAVDPTGRPIATAALSGNFTVANLATGSGFGASAAARSAFGSDGFPLAPETLIGPDTGVLQPIRPRSALLAAYYDPATLAPPSASGNQLIFINFVDTYTPMYRATSGFTSWRLFAAPSNGIPFPDTTITVNGVQVTDLASVLGDGVNGAAGGISFYAESDTVGLNRLVYFTESLGTFGTGYLLPPIPLRRILTS